MRPKVTGPDLLAPGEAARLLRIDTRTLIRWADRGRLNAVRLPSGHRRYIRGEVQALLNQRKARS